MVPPDPPGDEEDDDEMDRTATVSIQEILRSTLTEEQRRVAALVAIAGAHTGKVFSLRTGESILGRAKNAQIVIEDTGVSRHHCAITEDNGVYELRDLGSQNGTICNGARIESPVVLKPDDRIGVGISTVLKFGLLDETESKIQEQLYESATRDPLTRAHNRRHFEEALAGEWAWSQRRSQPCALIAIDADHFKKVNDVHGHPAGDYVLRELAQVVGKLIRREDVFARVGGEEFVVLARGTPIPQALFLARRIRSAVENHAFVFEGKRLPITVSIGVSTSADPGVVTTKDLTVRADEMLYKAKANGRNRVEPEENG